MTDPVRVGELLPGVLAEVVDRAGHGYARWAELVAQAGYCHHPIRLAGRVEHADRTTGEVRTVYDSEREPDGVLLKACGTRRESRCPSCAATYRADAYQLLAAGLKGGKGVPETVGAHPRLFVTFTAPSFGRVHTRKAQGRLVLPCHPYRQGARCPHGTRDGCWQRHDADDPRLGEPLCPNCYDAQAQVLWNALAPELWRRTTIALHRALAREVGVGEAAMRRLVRISYAKVAEYQKRGAIHFHAVIRLDAATSCRCPGCLLPPPEPFAADLLEDALKEAVAAVRAPCPSVDGGPGRYARWGEQLDVHNITSEGKKDDQDGELSAEQVAGYIAKYATKATESFGAGLDRRLTSADDLDHLEVLPAHVGELVRACWKLGGRPELEGLRLRAWAHMLGFGGHWSTKSRRYSTAFTVLRRARVAFAKRRRATDGVPLDAWDRPEDEEAVVLVASWNYVGAGYQTEGERWLALSAAARARERRRVAWDELTSTTLRRLALPTFGDAPLAAINQRDVRAWVAELSARGLAPATVQKAYQLLGKVMGAAVDAGMLAQSPCRRVPLPRVEREEMRFLTPAEVAALVDAIHARYRALVLVGAYGGLRIGELAGLRRSRVDLLRGTVQVAEIVVEVRGVLHIGPPKTRASRRTVGLPRFVVEELAAHIARPSDPEALVFRAPEGGPLRVNAFRARAWRQAATAAGLEGLRIHGLRHTAVALWIAAGANPKEVSARAGHSSVSFTLDRYGHLYPEADAALRDRLDALYGTAHPAPTSQVLRLARWAGRGPNVAPGGPGNDKSAADDTPATL